MAGEDFSAKIFQPLPVWVMVWGEGVSNRGMLLSKGTGHHMGACAREVWRSVILLQRRC